jgi:hypothetical protein
MKTSFKPMHAMWCTLFDTRIKGYQSARTVAVLPQQRQTSPLAWRLCWGI